MTRRRNTWKWLFWCTPGVLAGFCCLLMAAFSLLNLRYWTGYTPIFFSLAALVLLGYSLGMHIIFRRRMLLLWLLELPLVLVIGYLLGRIYDVF